MRRFVTEEQDWEIVDDKDCWGMNNEKGPTKEIKNSREKWRKCISVTGSLRGQAQVRPIDKLDEARTNADDQMMLVQHYSGDRVMSYRGFDRIS